MTRDINEMRERARIYSKEKTFTYVKETLPSGRENFYNGFIIKVSDEMIIFFDLVLKKEFPIMLDCLEVIEPSRKDMDIKTAWEIYEEVKNAKEK